MFRVVILLEPMAVRELPLYEREEIVPKDAVSKKVRLHNVLENGDLRRTLSAYCCPYVDLVWVFWFWHLRRQGVLGSVGLGLVLMQLHGTFVGEDDVGEVFVIIYKLLTKLHTFYLVVVSDQ